MLGVDAVIGLVGAVVGLLPLAVAGIVLVLWLRTRRPRVPASVGAAVAAAGYDPVAPPGTPVGQWNAQLSPGGGMVLPGQQVGVLRVENGWLGFHPAGPQSPPTWVVPAHQVRAGKNSVLARQEVWLETPATGRVNATVSHEHINQWMGNDLKDLRERRYADEFLWVLHQAGGAVAG
jgi:hypothetical protein